jgi:hypothetical protein
VVGSQRSWYNLDGKYREDEGCLIHVSSLIQTVFIIFVILLIDTRPTQKSFYLLLLHGVVGSCMNLFFVDGRFIHQLLYLWLMLGLTSTTYCTIVIQIFALVVLIDLHFVWFYLFRFYVSTTFISIVEACFDPNEHLKSNSPKYFIHKKV